MSDLFVSEEQVEARRREFLKDLTRNDRSVSSSDSTTPPAGPYLPREELMERLGRLQTEVDQLGATIECYKRLVDDRDATIRRQDAEIEGLERCIDILKDEPKRLTERMQALESQRAMDAFCIHELQEQKRKDSRLIIDMNRALNHIRTITELTAP